MKEQEEFQTAMRAAGETETTQDWLQLDGDSRFQLLTKEEISAVIVLYLFPSSLPSILLVFPIICFLSFLSSRAIFASLIRIIG
jgi:hypothetical protein